jgi:CheY-like chemotaxis protein
VLLSAVVDNVLEVSRPMIEAAGHELVLDLPRLPLQLDADPTRLAQIITNLLNNAARYTPGGGRIELAFKAEGDNLEITVRDNGVGIPRSMLDRVFDLFTQAEPGMGQAQGGLGIGLTLVKRLVEMHGGRVSAHSGGPGQGSCFHAVLPVVLAQADRPAPRPTEPVATVLQAGPDDPEHAARPLSVLVVDDNRDSAETLALVLELAGHRVATAHDGTHALALANAGAPEVAVLDIGLPDMTGHDLARRLRALPGGAQMLLVAVTGWGQAQDRNRSVAAGFDHHLVKPVDPAQLEALLATHRREG